MENFLGRNIANQRHRAHLTQEQLAELSDMTVNYLSKIERGVVKQIGSTNLYKISKALDVSMEDLLIGHPVNNQLLPNRQLLTRQLDLISPDKSEEYCDLFVKLLHLANEEENV